jgi:hypothetical protein
MSWCEWMLRRQWNWRIWDSPYLIDSLFVLLVCITKNTQVSLFTNRHFQPTAFPLLSNTPSLTRLICCSLSLSSPLTPHSVFICCSSHKYYDNFMRQYHWINFIEWTQLFRLGIAHNNVIKDLLTQLVWVYY